LKRICASSWTITKNHCMMHGQQNVKFYCEIVQRSWILGLNRHFVWSRLLFLLSHTLLLKYFLAFRNKLWIALSYCEPYCSGFLVRTGFPHPLAPHLISSLILSCLASSLILISFGFFPFDWKSFTLSYAVVDRTS